MFKTILKELGWLLVVELVFYRAIYSLAIAIIVNTLDKLGERKNE